MCWILVKPHMVESGAHPMVGHDQRAAIAMRVSGDSSGSSWVGDEMEGAMLKHGYCKVRDEQVCLDMKVPQQFHHSTNAPGAGSCQYPIQCTA